MEEYYTEAEDIASVYRKQYLDSITDLIKKKQDEKNKERVNTFLNNLDNIEKEREELKKMLGWPLYGGCEHKPILRLEYVGKDSEVYIYTELL